MKKIRNIEGLKSLGGQIFVDCCVHSPFFYFPAFYCCKEIMAYVSLPSEYNGDVVTNAVTRYIPNFIEDNVVMTMFWGPFNAIAFSLPPHLRLPCIHIMALVWNTYLSLFRGSDAAIEEEKAVAVQEGSKGNEDEVCP